MVIYTDGAFDWNTCWNLSPLERKLVTKSSIEYNNRKSGKSSNEILSND